VARRAGDERKGEGRVSLQQELSPSPHKRLRTRKRGHAQSPGRQKQHRDVVLEPHHLTSVTVSSRSEGARVRGVEARRRRRAPTPPRADLAARRPRRAPTPRSPLPRQTAGIIVTPPSLGKAAVITCGPPRRWRGGAGAAIRGATSTGGGSARRCGGGGRRSGRGFAAVPSASACRFALTAPPGRHRHLAPRSWWPFRRLEGTGARRLGPLVLLLLEERREERKGVWSTLRARTAVLFLGSGRRWGVKKSTR
jgi:hypothetical protein